MNAQHFPSATVFAGLCLLLPASIHAACDCAPMATTGLDFSCFSVNVSGTSAQRTDVGEGIGAWQSSCNSGALKVPQMQMYNATTNPDPCANYPANQVLSIQISFVGPQPAGNPPECGFADINFTARTGTIEIYDQSNDGGACSQRQEDIVAHELGHHLGFGDLDPGCQLTCSGRAMSGDIYQSGTVVDRNVSSEDCNRADQMNNPGPPLSGGGGGSGPCSEPVTTELKSLALTGTVPNGAVDRGTPLFTRRLEVVEGITYMMDDWAVVSFGRNSGGRPPAVRVERSSSPFFLPDREGKKLHQDIAGIALLIEAPAHLHNSRHIPTPEVRLRPTAIPYVGKQVTAALRIDVGEDRQIREIQNLHTVGPLPPGVDLMERVRSSLEVSYASNRQHRFIVFAVVDLADGRMLLRKSEVVLPPCCCNPICI